jgi:hypothetical protein
LTPSIHPVVPWARLALTACLVVWYGLLSVHASVFVSGSARKAAPGDACASHGANCRSDRSAAACCCPTTPSAADICGSGPRSLGGSILAAAVCGGLSVDPGSPATAVQAHLPSSAPDAIVVHPFRNAFDTAAPSLSRGVSIPPDKVPI